MEEADCGKSQKTAESETPCNVEEVRQRRLAYFEHAENSHSGIVSDKSKEDISSAAGHAAKECFSEKDCENVRTLSTKTSEFNPSLDETKAKRSSEDYSSSTKVILGKTSASSAGLVASSLRRRRTDSCSSTSDEDNTYKKIPSVLKPSSSIPSFSRSKSLGSVDNRSGWVSDEKEQKSTMERHGSAINYSSNEIDNLFSHRKRLPSKEVPSLSLKNSADAEIISVFKSKTDFDSLGLSTHRPESLSTSGTEYAEIRATKTRSKSSESPALGNVIGASKAEEMRSLLGDRKYQEFVEKSEQELSQLHKASESHHSTYCHKNTKVERVSQRDTTSTESSVSQAPHPPSPHAKKASTDDRGSSPQRRLRSSSPQAVSKTLQDMARHKETRGVETSRNYEQMAVPRNVTFSADEIYRQAYGGPTSDVYHSNSNAGSASFREVPNSLPIWNLLTPRQMAGMMSPQSPHNVPMFQPHLLPLNGGAIAYSPTTPPSQIYPQAPPPNSFFIPDGNGQFVPLSPRQHMLMAAPLMGSPPHASDPYLLQRNHMLSHSTGQGPYHSLAGHPSANAGVMPWQLGLRSFTLPWPEGQGLMQAPHPPTAADMRGKGLRNEDSAMSVHAEAVRQHHEQRRERMEMQQMQGASGAGSQPAFSAASIERYFASLEMPLPPSYPPPPYNPHYPSASPSYSPHNLQRDSIGQHQKSDSSYQGAEEKGIANDSSDHMTTVTNSSLSPGSSARVGGITERIEQLGLEPQILQSLRAPLDHAAADEEALEAMKSLVRLCPECGSLNKEYMTWCFQCCTVLIGVDTIAAKDARKIKKGRSADKKQRGNNAAVSLSRQNLRIEDGTDSTPHAVFSPPKTKALPKPPLLPRPKGGGRVKVASKPGPNRLDSPRSSAGEPVLEYAEDRFEETIYDKDGAPLSCEKERTLLITSPVSDCSMEKHAQNNLRDLKVGSPESGKGVSSASSPEGLQLVLGVDDEEEDFVQDTKDSGRPSSGEESRKRHSEAASEDRPIRTQQEICDICEVISDPIIRGFIKNYLQKKPNDLPAHGVGAKSKQKGKAFSSEKNDSQNISQPFSLDLGNGSNHTKTLRGAKKKTVKKGQEIVDVEIFAVEEAKLMRSARSGANLVPKLDLALSSDEENKPDREDSSLEASQLADSDSSSSAYGNAPVNYSEELQTLTAQDCQAREDSRCKTEGDGIGKTGNKEVRKKVETASEETEENYTEQIIKDEKNGLENEVEQHCKPSKVVHGSLSDTSIGISINEAEVERNFDFLKQLMDNPLAHSSSPSHRRSAHPRPQSPGQSRSRPNLVSKVRASVEVSPPRRHWMRSSIAWSSYNPRELRTRSSVNVLQSSSSSNVVKSYPGQARASRSADNLAEASASLNSTVFAAAPATDKRSRPASAELQARRVGNRGRPASASKANSSRPFSAGHLSIPYHMDQASASAASGDHLAGSQQHNESDIEYIPVQSPRSSETDIEGRPIHRLVVLENTLPLIPAGPTTAKKIYDRCIQTPRSELSQGSRWLFLPDELWLHVFTYLPQAALYSLLLTCKQLHNITLDPQLWKSVTVKKKSMKDEWLVEISKRHPVSLALVQCHGDRLSDGALKDLFRELAPKLKELNFSRCSKGKLVGDEILLHASTYCRQLTHIDASWCHVTDVGLTALAGCSHRLESLCLNGCQKITDDSLKMVVEKHGVSLRILELFGCFGLSPVSFRYLAEHCSFLLSLSIGQCYKISDSNMITLSASLSRVESLDLRGCKKLGNGSIRMIVRNCKRLRHLSLANCPQMTNSAVVEIATYAKDIRSLDVCGCSHIDDSSIKNLASNCNRLASIDISSTGCTHKSVLSLAEHCSNLECAKFNFLVDVREAALTKLVKNCKRLHTLHLYGCNVRDKEELRRYNPFLTICDDM